MTNSEVLGLPSRVIASPASVDAAIRVLQGELKALGFYAGAVDGAWGPLSRAAIDRFEAEN